MIYDTRQAFKHIDLVSEECAAEAHFKFAEDLYLFEGHFPDEPILPGVHQIEMVRTTVEAVLNTELRIVRVKNAKFLQKIIPSDEIIVRLDKLSVDEPLIAKATIRVGNEIVAKIILELMHKDPDSGIELYED